MDRSNSKPDCAVLTNRYSADTMFIHPQRVSKREVNFSMKVCVFGAGNMGARITEVFLNAGHDVTMIDIKPEFTERGKTVITHDYEFLVSKGKMTAERKDELLASLKTSVDRKDAADADFVMEVILERMDLKKDLLEDLDKICPAHTIFASNTSGLSITEMAACIPHRSDKFIGCHFFNPAQIMKLVEVTRATPDFGRNLPDRI